MTAGARNSAPASFAHFVHQYFLCLLIGLAMISTLLDASVFAQTAIDPTGRSGQPPGPLKEEFQRAQPSPRPVLPPLPPAPPEEDMRKELGVLQVFVREVRVIGNTAFSNIEIDEVTAPFKNRTVMTEDLERLRLALTLLYINRGYLTSGAIIPDQDVIDGGRDGSNHRGEADKDQY
ncbi:POTRA domain-containing protein [Candidatus Nitrospira nitrificans]|uniref:Surface antigen (D15) n=1 Tax=Candidatus Nitrospira nitrificans TaxID=1742973 RepID=A0A0S4L4T1_9BACT